MEARTAKVERKTKETDVSMTLSLDGKGASTVDTGVGFFDHMLEGFARHGFFDLEVAVTGDLNVDSHHTIEDVGIVLGRAVREAVGDKAGMRRYGSCILPMDDALVLCAIDVSGRGYLGYDLPFTAERVGEMDTEMVREFYYAFAHAAGLNLHIRKMAGENNHHIAEAAFKAFAKALAEAVAVDGQVEGVLSTKGVLA